ncbi:hypothetical protein FOCC_FOCC005151 [Frankliniella occidentalis]|nr:hypothetical protein FOCC_FOCC005151 [Frankliniella occidentalis]
MGGAGQAAGADPGAEGLGDARPRAGTRAGAGVAGAGRGAGRGAAPHGGARARRGGDAERRTHRRGHLGLGHRRHPVLGHHRRRAQAAERRGRHAAPADAVVSAAAAPRVLTSPSPPCHRAQWHGIDCIPSRMAPGPRGSRVLPCAGEERPRTTPPPPALRDSGKFKVGPLAAAARARWAARRARRGAHPGRGPRPRVREGRTICVDAVDSVPIFIHSGPQPSASLSKTKCSSVSPQYLLHVTMKIPNCICTHFV